MYAALILMLGVAVGAEVPVDFKFLCLCLYSCRAVVLMPVSKIYNLAIPLRVHVGMREGMMTHERGRKFMEMHDLG